MVRWFTRSGDRYRPSDLVRLIDPDHPCGPVAVALAAHLLGSPMTLDHARAAIDVDPLGRCSMSQLIGCLKDDGWTALGVKVSADELATLDANTVAVLYVDRSHFLAVVASGDGRIVVHDPPHRARAYKPHELPYDWFGETILVARGPNRLRQHLIRWKIRIPDDLALAPSDFVPAKRPME